MEEGVKGRIIGKVFTVGFRFYWRGCDYSFSVIRLMFLVIGRVGVGVEGFILGLGKVVIVWVWFFRCFVCLFC